MIFPFHLLRIFSTTTKHICIVGILVVGAWACSAESQSENADSAQSKAFENIDENADAIAFYTELESKPDHTYQPEKKSTLGDKPTWSANSGSGIDRLAFYAGGSKMITYSSKTGAVTGWDVNPLKRGATFSIEPSSLGMITAMAIEDNRLTVNGLKARAIWDITNGRKIENPPKRPHKYSISTDKSARASIEDGKAHVWNADTGVLLFSIPVEGKDARTISLSQDGALAAIAIEGADDEDAKRKSFERGGRAQIWEVVSGRLIAEIAYPRASFTFLRFTPDNNKFVAGAYTGRIVIWDLVENQKLTSIQIGDGLRSMEINPDGTLLATGGSMADKKYTDMGVAALWDIETGAQLHTQWFPDRVGSAPFSPEGSTYWAASSWGGAIQIVDYAPFLKRSE